MPLPGRSTNDGANDATLDEQWPKSSKAAFLCCNVALASVQIHFK
jgi:hypothetical protein